ncbi:MAG: hypothetical protein Q7S75_02400 [bacterium]|nr:hypothetical protein [bacterium]
MDETKQDTTANPATGSDSNPAPSPAPAAPVALKVAPINPVAAASADAVPAISVMPGTVPTQPKPPTPQILVAQSTPVPTVAPVQSVPPPPAPTQGIPVASASQTQGSAESPDAKALHDDIARILEEVKLPERRKFTTSGDVSKEAQEVAEAAASQMQALLQKETPLQNVPPSPAKSVEAPVTVGAPQNVQSAQPVEVSKDANAFVTSIHTLKDDLQNVVRDKKMSLVHAVTLEEEKKRGQEKVGGAVQSEVPHKKNGIILGVLVLALIIAGGLFGIYIFMQGRVPASAEFQDTPLFFADKTVPFQLVASSGTDLKRTLAQELSASRSSIGAITRIVPIVLVADEEGAQSERLATIEEFLKGINSQAMPDLIRSFRGDLFLGIHAEADRNAPVLIIPVSSYERAFAGMLAWESTINDDLAPFFTPVPPLTVDESGLLVNRKFEDSIMLNYDVRVLKDDSGAVKLIYSFPTRNVLVIVESSYSFTEVLGRLRASRQL